MPLIHRVSRRPRPLAALAMAALLLTTAPLAADEMDAGAYLAARTAATRGDYLAAEQWHLQALAADPGNATLQEGLLVSQMALGDFEGAAATARSMALANAKNPIANMALLIEQARAGDFDAMLAARKAGQQTNPLLDDLAAAWAEFGKGRMSEATAGFDAIAQEKGAEAFGLYHQALALAAVGDFEAADAILSGKAEGELNLTRRGIIAHAEILSQLEKNQAALDRLDHAFGPDTDPEIDALRARLKAGETLPYDVALNATDGIAEVFFTMAGALNGQADDAYTLIYTRAAAFLRPTHTEAVLLAAGLLEQQGQYDLATQAYARIAPEDPSYYVAQIGRAGTTIAAGDVDGGIALLQQLNQTNGTIFTVPLALADALRRAERFDQAVPAYDQAIALIPAVERPHWPIFFSRGIAKERSGDFPGAEADMRKALALEPDQPQVLNYLGYSFVDRGENLDEALDMIQRAVKGDPEQGYILDSLAWAYFRLGRYQDALAPMEKASLLEPVDAIVTDHLGDVYWMVGRKREAESQWHRALSFEPEEKDAARIQKKLKLGLDAVLAEELAPDAPAPDAPAPDAGN